VPQHTAQIFSALAGQKRPGFRFSQIGQVTKDPLERGRIKEYHANLICCGSPICSSKKIELTGGSIIPNVARNLLFDVFK
jgi:hypothetical protein